jgi:hypothetical protein
MEKINGIVSVGIIVSTFAGKELCLFYHALFPEMFVVDIFIEFLISEYPLRTII